MYPFKKCTFNSHYRVLYFPIRQKKFLFRFFLSVNDLHCSSVFFKQRLGSLIVRYEVVLNTTADTETLTREYIMATHELMDQSFEIEILEKKASVASIKLFDENHNCMYSF